MKISSCKKIIINIPREKIPVSSVFPVSGIITATTSERIINAMCETGFRRSSTLKMADDFIITNLTFIFLTKIKVISGNSR
jgi:hypothetical protein